MKTVEIYQGDALEVLRGMRASSVQTCITSPPYWGLRNYGVAGQIGLESTPEEYVVRMVAVFREVRRVLRDDGTLWLNLGDSYSGSCMTGGTNSINGRGKKMATMFRRGNSKKNGGVSNRDGIGKVPGLKPKDLVGIPWRVAFALQADGWYLRSDIIWHKPNPMPESVTDRPTKAHEYLFLLAKSERYYYDSGAILEPFQTSDKENYPQRARITGRGDQGAARARGNDRGKSGGFPPRETHTGRNRRTVWTVTTRPFKGAHFATFPPRLIEPCVLAGAPKGGIVLDPFNGAGTTGLVATQNGRRYVGIELNPEYIPMTWERLGIIQAVAA